MRNKGNADYTNRPLNNAEREFAALPENHNLIFDYMKCKRLDPETFYDELILDYLTAVKQYVTEKPELQINFSFKTILFQRLNGRMMHYWREYYADCRTMERKAVRLDYEYENDKQDRCSRVEPWWIDPTQNVERYVVEKEFLNDLYSNIYRYAEPDLLKLIVDMRQEGYSNREIARKAVVVIEDYQDWGIRETTQLITVLCGL
ncbi:MAG: hypothetical protein K2N85_04240 [Lachnospiraceae bacterium]|nr:hypothetical protein [Lachnospiraceae bacterium]